MSLQDFFYAFNLCKNFFSRLFTLCYLLARFFFSDVMAAQIFFPGIFLCTKFFGGNFHPPPPEISNDPPLSLVYLFQLLHNSRNLFSTQFNNFNSPKPFVGYVQDIYATFLTATKKELENAVKKLEEKYPEPIIIIIIIIIY